MLKLCKIFLIVQCILFAAKFTYCQLPMTQNLTRRCRNRCYDKNNLFCGISFEQCKDLWVRLICPRTCEMCRCELETCEDGTCTDVWEPSLCEEFKREKSCALTRLISGGSCAKSCGDCKACRLPCNKECKDYGDLVKCQYFVLARFCYTFPDAAILCPKSCGVCRTCPKTPEELFTIRPPTIYYTRPVFRPPTTIPPSSMRPRTRPTLPSFLAALIQTTTRREITLLPSRRTKNSMKVEHEMDTEDEIYDPIFK